MVESDERDGVHLSLSARRVIDDICDAFEARLLAGEEPRIEDALANCPETCRPQLFRELLKMEREYRQKRADEDYRRRFPEYASVMDALKVPALVGASVPASDALTTPSHDTVDQRDDTLPIIPGYELLSKLGEGGMGVVYKARQLKLDRVVALKMMRAGQFAGAEKRQRFRFEAEAIAALDHSNIAPVYNFGDVGGDSFLCLKYFEGGSLADRLKERRYTPKDAARLMSIIARAVQHAHDRGILHRDLKPANILLDAADQPHVADFGLARRLKAEHSLTQPGAIVGTLNYMAPEQARGEKGLTVKADIYALGAILYELLAGVPPFKGDTRRETLLLLCGEGTAVRPRQLNPKTPRDLDAICLKCLEKEPANRYASAEDLADDLTRFLHNEPISAQPPGIWDWLVQAMRTRPAPSPEHTWQAPVCIGSILFVQHVAVFVLVRTAQLVWILWAIVLAGSLGIFLVLWFLNLPRFRVVPVTERHSIMVALGHLVAHIVLFLTVVPWNPRDSCRPVLAMYPALTVVSGLCLFILGSTNWGRLFPVGVVTMCLALVVAAYPEQGPLLYAATVPIAVIVWGLATWWYFVRPKETGLATPTATSNLKTTDR